MHQLWLSWDPLHLAPAADWVQVGSMNHIIFLGPVATQWLSRFSRLMECMGPTNLQKHISALLASCPPTPLAKANHMAMPSISGAGRYSSRTLGEGTAKSLAKDIFRRK